MHRSQFATSSGSDSPFIPNLSSNTTATTHLITQTSEPTYYFHVEEELRDSLEEKKQILVRRALTSDYLLNKQKTTDNYGNYESNISTRRRSFGNGSKSKLAGFERRHHGHSHKFDGGSSENQIQFSSFSPSLSGKSVESKTTGDTLEVKTLPEVLSSQGIQGNEVKSHRSRSKHNSSKQLPEFSFQLDSEPVDKAKDLVHDESSASNTTLSDLSIDLDDHSNEDYVYPKSLPSGQFNLEKKLTNNLDQLAYKSNSLNIRWPDSLDPAPRIVPPSAIKADQTRTKLISLESLPRRRRLAPSQALATLRRDYLLRLGIITHEQILNGNILGLTDESSSLKSPQMLDSQDTASSKEKPKTYFEPLKTHDGRNKQLDTSFFQIGMFKKIAKWFSTENDSGIPNQGQASSDSSEKKPENVKKEKGGSAEPLMLRSHSAASLQQQETEPIGVSLGLETRGLVARSLYDKGLRLRAQKYFNRNTESKIIRNKNVSFLTETEIMTIPNRHRMSQRTKHKLWYTRQEFMALVLSNMKQIEQEMKKKEDVEKGLEALSVSRLA